MLSRKFCFKGDEDDKLLYASVLLIMERGECLLLEQEGQEVFLYDKIMDGYVLWCQDGEQGKKWLDAHKNCGYELLLLFDEETARYAAGEFGSGEVMECYQAVYEEGVCRETASELGLEIRRASADEDFFFVRSLYDQISDDELLRVINRGQLFIGEAGGEVIGFVGWHLEGSMGLLLVREEFRGRGYGEALERFIIAESLRRGIIPVGQVETDNERSLALQRKIGFSLSQKKVFWVF